MYKYLLIFIIYIFTLPLLVGQSDDYADENILKGIIYRNEFSIDTRIHTNGFAMAVNFGNIITYRRSKYYHIEIGYIKDPREQKQTRNLGFLFNTGASSFKLGKQNAMFAIRGGVGRKRFVSDKAKRKGIAIGYSYEIGPSIALLKPYYLDLQYQVETNGQTSIELRSEKYSPDNADKFLDYTQVFGASRFNRGLKEISIVPGGQAKAGLFFSLGAYDEYIKSIEIGLMADLYLTKIPIMVETSEVTNKPYFINLYAHLQLGKRTN
jgi:hypothetical protein